MPGGRTDSQRFNGRAMGGPLHLPRLPSDLANVSPFRPEALRQAPERDREEVVVEAGQDPARERDQAPAGGRAHRVRARPQQHLPPVLPVDDGESREREGHLEFPRLGAASGHRFGERLN